MFEYLNFINKIKEHRHDKIKKKNIKKFEKLYFKRFGYHHNLNRHTASFGNINHNSQDLSRQSNVPSQPIILPLSAFLPHPWPPHLPPTQHTSNQQPTNQCPDNQFPTMQVPATWTNGLSTFPKPPSPRINYPCYKKDPTVPSHLNTPPHRSIYHFH